MLLIDGVMYKLWTPRLEDDLERVVKEHAKDIFGNDSLYLDLKQKLKSKAGVGSIPDGYVITLEDKPHWHIVEVELSSHPLYEHIVVQITKFVNGIANPYAQKVITDAIDEEISKDEVLKAWIKSKIGSEEIHRFLSKLISTSPVIAIIIDEKTKELEEVCNSLPGEKKIIELKTFEREGVGLGVHAHLFEPLEKLPLPSPEPTPTPTPLSPELEVIVRNPSFINFHLFSIPKGGRRFFPGYKIPFKLETDIGEIQTHVSSAPAGTQVGDPDAGVYIQTNLAEWYRRHPTIKVGDKVLFEAIEPMKRYRLKIA